MGQKEFTDWNGRKRHDALYPPREKDVRAKTFSRKEKPSGVKVKADRYKARQADIRRYWEWRRDSQKRHREWVKEKHDPRFVEWHPHWEEFIRRDIRELRKLREKYQKEGVWEKVTRMLKL